MRGSSKIPNFWKETFLTADKLRTCVIFTLRYLSVPPFCSSHRFHIRNYMSLGGACSTFTTIRCGGISGRRHVLVQSPRECIQRQQKSTHNSIPKVQSPQSPVSKVVDKHTSSPSARKVAVYLGSIQWFGRKEPIARNCAKALCVWHQLPQHRLALLQSQVGGNCTWSGVQKDLQNDRNAINTVKKITWNHIK